MNNLLPTEPKPINALSSIDHLARTRQTFTRKHITDQLLTHGVDTSAYEWALRKLEEPGFIVDLGGGVWRSEITPCEGCRKGMENL